MFAPPARSKQMNGILPAPVHRCRRRRLERRWMSGAAPPSPRAGSRTGSKTAGADDRCGAGREALRDEVAAGHRPLVASRAACGSFGAERAWRSALMISMAVSSLIEVGSVDQRGARCPAPRRSPPWRSRACARRQPPRTCERCDQPVQPGDASCRSVAVFDGVSRRQLRRSAATWRAPSM